MTPLYLVEKLYGETILPDLLEIFGNDKTLDLVEIFGGKSIYIPSKADLRKIFVANEVFTRLYGLSQNDYFNEMRRISKDLDLSYEKIREIFYDEKAKFKHREGKLESEMFDEKFGVKNAIKDTIVQLSESLNFDPTKHRRYKRDENYLKWQAAEDARLLAETEEARMQFERDYPLPDDTTPLPHPDHGFEPTDI